MLPKTKCWRTSTTCEWSGAHVGREWPGCEHGDRRGRVQVSVGPGHGASCATLLSALPLAETLSAFAAVVPSEARQRRGVLPRRTVQGHMGSGGRNGATCPRRCHRLPSVAEAGMWLCTVEGWVAWHASLMRWALCTGTPTASCACQGPEVRRQLRSCGPEDGEAIRGP